MTALEAAVPLLVVAAVSASAGFLAAQLYLASQLNYSVRAARRRVLRHLAAGLAASLAVISTLPLLRRVTGPETARNQ